MIDKIAKILEKPVCNNCLGRQFAQLLSGYTNKERGEVIRTFAAMLIDSNSELKCDMNNFHSYKFRYNKEAAKLSLKKEKCSICNNFFESIPKIAEKILKKTAKYQFRTFLIGSKISNDLLNREEELWEETGIDYCESLRAEVNREVGKALEKLSGKKADTTNPDIRILLDLENNKIDMQITPLFIFGYYQKLVRGIPQCKWGTPHKYRNSVEQIIGRPILKATKGFDCKFHGCGREDIDALCLGWRPFVIEITEPKIREIDLKKIIKEINKGKVNVKHLKFADMKTVRLIKLAKPDKTYRAIIALEKPIDKKDLVKLKKLKGIIKQRTPKRVLHRRADKLRKREVKDIKFKIINKKKIEITVTTEAGLYIKELISGDEGRTKPSVSELLGQKAVCKILDVIKIKNIQSLLRQHPS